MRSFETLIFGLWSLILQGIAIPISILSWSPIVFIHLSATERSAAMHACLSVAVSASYTHKFSSAALLLRSTPEQMPHFNLCCIPTSPLRYQPIGFRLARLEVVHLVKSLALVCGDVSCPIIQIIYCYYLLSYTYTDYLNKNYKSINKMYSGITQPYIWQ